MSANFRWEGVQEFNAGFDRYERRVKQAVYQVAQYWQAVFEAEAKEQAIWNDITGNARATLHSFIEELANDTTRLFLSHGVEYGLWLEVANAGRYQIVWRVIERHLEEIRLMLQRIFGSRRIATGSSF